MRLRKRASKHDYLPSEEYKSEMLLKCNKLSKELMGSLVSHSGSHKVGIVVSVDIREILDYLSGISLTIRESIKEFNKDLIFVVLPITEMEKAAKNLNLKYACEIFADRNYEDNGQLVSRSKKYAFVTDPKLASTNILEMLDNSYIKCYSGKKIKCEIDTICIHGDGDKALLIAENLKNSLLQSNIQLLNLNKLKKFM